MLNLQCPEKRTWVPWANGHITCTIVDCVGDTWPARRKPPMDDQTKPKLDCCHNLERHPVDADEYPSNRKLCAGCLLMLIAVPLACCALLGFICCIFWAFFKGNDFVIAAAGCAAYLLFGSFLAWVAFISGRSGWRMARVFFS